VGWKARRTAVTAEVPELTSGWPIAEVTHSGFLLSTSIPKLGRDLVIEKLSVLMTLLFRGSQSASERQYYRVYAVVVDCAVLSKDHCVAYAITDN
jgi:hypothetical protein